MKTYLIAAIGLLAMLALPGTAFAYVGPGAGISLIGAFWALLVALLTAIGFLVAWPMRRMLRQGRQRRAQADQQMQAAYDRQGDRGRRLHS